MFRSILRHLLGVRRAGQKPAAPRNVRRRPALEVLEDRLTPDATFMAAIGGSVTVNLSDLFASAYLNAAQGVTVDSTTIAVGGTLNFADGVVTHTASGTPTFADDSLTFTPAGGAGQFNFKVDLLPNGQPAAETVHILVEAPQNILVTPSVSLTAADSVYNGRAYAGAVSVSVLDGASNVSGLGTTALKFYSDSAATKEIAVPINAGTYYVKAFFTSDGQVHDGETYANAASAVVSFTIAKADASLAIGDYSGTYDGAYHGLSGTALGVQGEDLSGLLHLGAAYKHAGNHAVAWSFAGNENYNSANGMGLVAITALSLDEFATASTQSALNIAKDGTVSFALNVAGGIVDGQTVAQLFNNSTFTLSMKTGKVDASGAPVYEKVTITASAAVIDGIVYVNLRMSQDFYTFLKQGLDSGEINAARASLESINLSATSNDGNYTVSADALTRIFQTGKVVFA